MKKIIFCGVLCLWVITSQAQMMLLGVKGSYNTTWLMNKNIFDQGDEINHSTSFAPSYGINGTFFFNDNLGISLEANMNQILQKYSGVTGTDTWDGFDKLNYMEIPLLLNLANKGGLYFEIGPKISFLTSATGESVTSPSSVFDYNQRDIKTGFATTMFSGVFGFGVNVKASDLVYILAGLRFNASFTDATVKRSEAELLQDLSGDKIGITSLWAHLNQVNKYEYEKTTAVSGGIVFGIGFRLSNKSE